MKEGNIKNIIIGILVGLVLILGINIVTNKEDNNYKNGKSVDSRELFISKAIEVYNSSKSKAISSQLNGNNNPKYYESSKDDLNIDNIYYFVKTDKDGNVIWLIANDSNYKVIVGSSSSTTPINGEEIGKFYEVIELESSPSTVIGDSNKNGLYDLDDAYIIINNGYTNKELADINNDNIIDQDDAYEIIAALSKNYLSGDVNRDGKVNSDDSKLVQGYLNKSESFDESQKSLADIDKNGKVDNNDLKAMGVTPSDNTQTSTSSTSKSKTQTKTESKVKYVVKHYKQKITKDKNNPEYDLAETQNLTATALSSVTPGVKTYIGFKSPSKKTVTVAKNGSTIVNYYYTRNTYKANIYSECSRTLNFKYDVIENMTSNILSSINNLNSCISDTHSFGSINSTPNTDRLHDLVNKATIELYYEQELTIDARNADGSRDGEIIAFYDGTKLLSKAQQYTFKMPAKDVTYTVKYGGAKAKYIVNHWIQKVADDVQDKNHYKIYSTEEVYVYDTDGMKEIKHMSFPSFPDGKWFTPKEENQKVIIWSNPILSDPKPEYTTTTIDYYYKRTKYKFELWGKQKYQIDAVLKKEYGDDYIVSISNNGTGNAIENKYNLELYNEQVVELTAVNGDVNTKWYDGNNKNVYTGKTYEFKFTYPGNRKITIK